MCSATRPLDAVLDVARERLDLARPAGALGRDGGEAQAHLRLGAQRRGDEGYQEERSEESHRNIVPYCKRARCCFAISVQPLLGSICTYLSHAAAASLGLLACS